MGISISGEGAYDVTIISNVFIDHFMPHVNGTYVKVYLYLLRCLAKQDAQLSVSAAADFLGETENDIVRAVTCLEKHGLLRVSRSQNGAISGICICDLLPPDMSAAAAADQLADIDEFAAAAMSAAGTVSVTAADSVPMPEAANQPANPVAETEPAKPSSARLDIPTYSKSQIQALSSNEEVKWIMSIAERYLERLLNPTDIQLIVYLYESVGFPAELILYLYEYCASRGKKSPSYIEAVAVSWAEQGICTVEAAEEASLKYNANYNAVAKAFGLNRTPGAAELQYIDRWSGHASGQFGFSLDMITEACSRSLLATQRPDFKYADRILANWHRNGIKTQQDVQKADQIHSQNAAKTYHVSTQKAGTQKGATNRFNAFPQRSYSGEDYSSLEQKLLNRQGS